METFGRISTVFVALLGLGVLIIGFRELPGLKRYIKMSMM